MGLTKPYFFDTFWTQPGELVNLEKCFYVGMGALLTLLCLKFPVWGIIHLERKFDTYPIVSQQTIATLDQMSATLGDFSEACEWHQAAERDEYYLDPNTDTERLAAVGADVESATAAMYAAVAARKSLSAQADWGLLKSMLIGGQGYTHSTWLCAPAYAMFSTQINVGFTPTYDTAT
jgi:hypothetical protein